MALLIFGEFDAFDQARLALRDGTFVKFGEETGPIRAPDYGAYRFTRVAGPTPDAPDARPEARPTQGLDQEAEGGIDQPVPCAKAAMMRVWPLGRITSGSCDEHPKPEHVGVA